MTAVQTLAQQNLESILNFDGKDDYIDLGNKPEFKINKNLTISAWINATHNNQKLIIIPIITYILGLIKIIMNSIPIKVK
ncbi:hypothetical protein [Cyanothece sp. BG0011]|uniref:hypothetical protein n=1 Tax=Cyanothece sp. BG0011 TaxID=2082950 RepID=UPI000D1F853A|nr:hypothetical protein [Cyanothece sp. BG0011]